MRKYNANKDVVEVHAKKGDLVVKVFPDGTLEIESQRGTSFRVTDLDYSGSELAKSQAPIGTTHELHSYRVDEEGHAMGLNGDVYSVYIGQGGIILDNPAKRRVKELPEDGPKRRGDS